MWIHGVEAVSEVELTDKLHVSGREPPSLAKFISTSDLVCRRAGDAVQLSSLTSCKNVGWSVQRHASRSRPLTRMARRFVPLWAAAGAEASSDSARREAAIHLVREPTGANSHRLVLAGMITDISVEHRKCVSGGDIVNPDSERDESLGVLVRRSGDP